VSPSLCLSHCVSLTVSRTVSLSPSLSLCLSHRLSHCVSRTMSFSPSLSLCLSHRLSHCVSRTVSLALCLSHCVSLAVSRTVSLSLCLSHRLSRAAQAPKQIYTLADLRLNSIEPAALLSPKDTTLEGVRNTATLAAAAGLIAATVAFELSGMEILRNVVVLLGAKTVDQACCPAL
jgi:hypothetical protein